MHDIASMYNYLKEQTKGKSIDRDQLYTEILALQKNEAAMQQIKGLIMYTKKNKHSGIHPVSNGKFVNVNFDLDSLDDQTILILQGYMDVKYGRL